MAQNEGCDIEKQDFTSGVKLELIGGKKVKTAPFISIETARHTNARNFTWEQSRLIAACRFPVTNKSY